MSNVKRTEATNQKFTVQDVEYPASAFVALVSCPCGRKDCERPKDSLVLLAFVRDDGSTYGALLGPDLGSALAVDLADIAMQARRNLHH